MYQIQSVGSYEQAGELSRIAERPWKSL